MADFDANVERVFGNFATLDTGAGSIQKQFVYAQDTNQIGVHLLDDSMEWFSSDAKQVLLARDETITGEKTFDNNVLLTNTRAIMLGNGGLLVGNEDGVTLETSSGKEFVLNSSANFRLNVDGVEICQGYPNGMTLPRDILLSVGDDTSSGTLSNDGTKTTLRSFDILKLEVEEKIELSLNEVDAGNIDETGVHLNDKIGLFLGGDNFGQFMWDLDQGGVVLQTLSGSMLLKSYDELVLESGQDNLKIKRSGVEILRVDVDGSDTKLVSDDHIIRIDSPGFAVDYSGDPILSVSSSGLTLETDMGFFSTGLTVSGGYVFMGNGWDFKIGRAFNSASVPTSDGFIEIYDVNGKLLRVPAYDASGM